MSLQNAADGIFKCLENVEELIEEALYLEKKSRKARALSLLVVALEENSKITYILTESSLESSSNQIKKDSTKHFLRKFKGGITHKTKQKFGLGLDELDLKGKKFEEKYKIVIEMSEKIQSYTEKARQDGLYVNFTGGRFLSPTESLRKNPHFSNSLNYKKFKEKVIKQLKVSRQMFGKDKRSCLKFLVVMRFLMNPENLLP